MGKDSYTVIVVPQQSSQVKRYKLSTTHLKGVASVFTAIFILSAWLVYDYATVKGEVGELKELREQNQAQNEQIRSFVGKITAMESQMLKLRQFDAKLRIITNLEKPGGREQYIGIGGPGEEVADDYGSRKDMLIQKMHSDLENMQIEAAVQEESFVELQEFLEDKKSLLASTPSIWPVRGWITSGFGKRVSPFTGTWKMHDGIDIATRTGTTIVAPADGRVMFAGIESGYGKLLVIDHGYGVVTRYGHNSEIFARQGDIVKRGVKVAAVGTTGRSTGPHVHYEVRVNGVPVNPKNYILN
ncbi:MAG: M23 family metallopeptidase [bacterium]|nr:M23 family metallopeptidase [bacterium]